MATVVRPLAVIVSVSVLALCQARTLDSRQSAKDPLLVSTSSQFQFANSTSSDGSGTIGYGGNVTLTQYGLQDGPARFDSGCGTNWQRGSYGGGFNAATVDVVTQKTLNGVGGGFTFNATNVDIGLGMSYNVDQTLNVHLNVAKDGSVLLSFNTTNSSPFVCTPNGQTGMTCAASAKKM